MTGREELTFVSVEAVLTRFDPHGRLARYFELLGDENRRLNLVSRETDLAGMRKLAAESLLPFEKVPLINVRRYLDVGSGGGFPAIPVLLRHPVERAVLVERTGKKAAALQRLLLGLDIRAEIIGKTFEEVSLKEEFDLVTIRQVRMSPLLLDRLLALLAKGGVLVCYAACQEALDRNLVNVTTFCSSISSAGSRMTFTVISKK